MLSSGKGAMRIWLHNFSRWRSWLRYFSSFFSSSSGKSSSLQSETWLLQDEADFLLEGLPDFEETFDYENIVEGLLLPPLGESIFARNIVAFAFRTIVNKIGFLFQNTSLIVSDSALMGGWALAARSIDTLESKWMLKITKMILFSQIEDLSHGG